MIEFEIETMGEHINTVHAETWQVALEELTDDDMLAVRQAYHRHHNAPAMGYYPVTVRDAAGVSHRAELRA